MKKETFGPEEDRIERLLRILRSEPAAEDCQAYLDQLDDYITMQLAREDYLANFAGVAGHLDACVQCAQAYARLYELVAVEVAGQLPSPSSMPEPDLSFLQPAGSNQAQVRRLSEQLRRVVQQTAEKITLFLSADLLNMLQPAATAVPPTRTPADPERYQEILLQLQPAHIANLDLPFHLTAYRDAQQPHTCLIELIVTPPGRSWPELGGYHVRLQAAGSIWDAVTDAWGLAAFTGIDVASLPQLQIEITLHQATAD